MTSTPDLPPLPDSLSDLLAMQGISTGQKIAAAVRSYARDRAAAAVLAERAKSEAIRAALVEFLAIEYGAAAFATLSLTQRLRIANRKAAAIDAARAAIRAEPKQLCTPPP